MIARKRPPANPHVYRRSGAPAVWFAPWQGPRRTFPGDVGDVADLMCGRSTAVQNGSVSWSLGEFGPALAFNASGYYSCSDASLYGNSGATLPTGPNSVLAWIKAGGATGVFFALGHAGNNINAGISSGYIRVGNAVYGYNAGLIPDNIRLHLLAYSYDGTKARIYLDGGFVGQTASYGTYIQTTGNSLVIGSSHEGLQPFTGMIADVQFYLRTLSDSEHEQAYADPWWRLRPFAFAGKGSSFFGPWAFRSTATLAGLGTVAPVGAAPALSQAAIAGVGAVAPVGAAPALSQAAIAGVGAVAPVGFCLAIASAAVTGSAAISLSNTSIFFATAAIAGSSALSIHGSCAASGMLAIAGTSAIAMPVSATATGSITVTGESDVGLLGQAANVAIVSIAGVSLFLPVGSWIKIREALISGIKADSQTSTLVGLRVFPGLVPESQVRPAITVHLLSDTPDRNLDGPNRISTARVLFTSHSKLLTDDESVTERLRNLMDGLVNSAFGGIVVCWAQLDPEADDFTDSGDGTGRADIRTFSTYLITYRRPAPIR